MSSRLAQANRLATTAVTITLTGVFRTSEFGSATHYGRGVRFSAVRIAPVDCSPAVSPNHPEWAVPKPKCSASLAAAWHAVHSVNTTITCRFWVVTWLVLWRRQRKGRRWAAEYAQRESESEREGG